jgi:GAF domain-containing protein
MDEHSCPRCDGRTEAMDRSSRLSALWAVFSGVSRSLDPTLVLQSLAEIAARVEEVAFVTVALLDAERGEIVAQAASVAEGAASAGASSRPTTRRLRDLAPFQRLLAGGDPEWVTEAGDLDGFLPPGGEIPVLLVPMTVAGRTTGALCVGMAGPRVLSPEEKTLWRAIAGQTATALENARLYQTQVRSCQEMEARRWSAAGTTTRRSWIRSGPASLSSTAAASSSSGTGRWSR